MSIGAMRKRLQVRAGFPSVHAAFDEVAAGDAEAHAGQQLVRASRDVLRLRAAGQADSPISAEGLLQSKVRSASPPMRASSASTSSVMWGL
jgi:hypothetical protein